MQTCSVAPANDFAWGKSLPSNPWSCRKLPFASWPAAILVQRHTDDAITGYSPHVCAVCDVILKTWSTTIKILNVPRRVYGKRG